MAFRFRLFLFCLPFLCLPVHAADVPEKTISFKISDGLGDDQIDEEILVSVNHVTVGIFKVDAAKPLDTMTVTIPAALTYHYDLCGHLNEKGPGGKPIQHKIDNGAYLADMDGRSFEAMNNDSTVFYLVDRTPGKSPVRPRSVSALQSCANTVAMR